MLRRLPTSRGSASTTAAGRSWRPSTCWTSATGASGSSPSNWFRANTEGRATPERHSMGSFHVPVERLAGYRQALEAAGIDWISVPIQERHPGPGGASAAGHSGGAALLDLAERPTAILAMSDEL